MSEHHSQQLRLTKFVEEFSTMNIHCYFLLSLNGGSSMFQHPPVQSPLTNHLSSYTFPQPNQWHPSSPHMLEGKKRKQGIWKEKISKFWDKNIPNKWVKLCLVDVTLTKGLIKQNVPMVCVTRILLCWSEKCLDSRLINHLHVLIIEE